MVQKLAKLNKKELKFVEDTSLNEDDFEEQILENRRFKTFFRELKKIEKKHGYTYEAYPNIINMIGFYGFSRFEVIEEYIDCFKDDLKEGAKRYFEYYY